MFALKTLTRWTTVRSNKPVTPQQGVKLPMPIDDRDIDVAIEETLRQYPVVMAALAKIVAEELAEAATLSPDVQPAAPAKPMLEVAYDDAL